IARRAEIRGTPERRDRFTGAIVVEQRFTEKRIDLRRPRSVAGVLHRETKHLFTLRRITKGHARRTEEAETFRDETACFRVEHLPLGRPKENRERSWPLAEELNDLLEVALRGCLLGGLDVGKIYRAPPGAAGRPRQLLPDVVFDSLAKNRQWAGFL